MRGQSKPVGRKLRDFRNTVSSDSPEIAAWVISPACRLFHMLRKQNTSPLLWVKIAPSQGDHCPSQGRAGRELWAEGWFQEGGEAWAFTCDCDFCTDACREGCWSASPQCVQEAAADDHDLKGSDTCAGQSPPTPRHELLDYYLSFKTSREHQHSKLCANYEHQYE